MIPRPSAAASPGDMLAAATACAEAQTPSDLLMRLMSELTRLTRELATNLKRGEAMATDPLVRVTLEKMLADFDLWHPAMVTSAREVGQARALLKKMLRRRRFGLHL
jgi:hypothetical protein